MDGHSWNIVSSRLFKFFQRRSGSECVLKNTEFWVAVTCLLILLMTELRTLCIQGFDVNINVCENRPSDKSK